MTDPARHPNRGRLTAPSIHDLPFGVSAAEKDAWLSGWRAGVSAALVETSATRRTWSDAVTVDQRRRARRTPEEARRWMAEVAECSEELDADGVCDCTRLHLWKLSGFRALVTALDRLGLIPAALQPALRAARDRHPWG